MITKGEAFTFMYEARHKDTGALVTDAQATHTITVYYIYNGAWTAVTLYSRSPAQYTSSSTTYPAFITSDTGRYLCRVSSDYTSCDHIIVSIESSNTNVIIPLQQFYPVNTSSFSGSGSGTYSLSASDISSIAQKVWSYGDPASSGDPRTGSRTLYGASQNELGTIALSNIASSVWGNSTRTLSSATGGSGNNEFTLATTSNVATNVWTDSSVTRALNSEYIGSNRILLYSDLGSLPSSDQSGDTTTTTTASLTLTSQNLRDIANSVWTYEINSQTPVAAITSSVWSADSRKLTSNQLGNSSDYIVLTSNVSPVSIADAVWCRNNMLTYPNGQARQLTSLVIADGSGDKIAKSGEFQVSITSDNFDVTIPSAEDIASEVWTGDYARALTTTTVGDDTLATKDDTDTIAEAVADVADDVWGADTRTLTAATLESGSLATSTDIPESPDVSSLTTIVSMLEKICGALFHWKIENNTITVYKDNNDVLFTIPTAVNKYGDITQMGSIPGEE